MKKVYLIGFDVGFSSLGIVKAELLPQSVGIVDVKVVTTKKAKKSQKVRATDDTVRRMMEITKELQNWLDDDVIAICAEAQSWPTFGKKTVASVCAKLGMAWGVLTALSVEHGIPIIQASPIKIKQAVTGNTKVSKEDVIAAISQRFPKMKWPRQKALREHAADATAAIIACLNDPQIILAKKLLFTEDSTAESNSKVLDDKVVPLRKV